MVLQIAELAEALATESEAFHRAASGQGCPSRVVPALEPSTEWLRRAFCAMLFGMVALRNAGEELRGLED